MYIYTRTTRITVETCAKSATWRLGTSRNECVCACFSMYIHIYTFLHRHIYIYTYTNIYTCTYIHVQQELPWKHAPKAQRGD